MLIWSRIGQTCKLCFAGSLTVLPYVRGPLAMVELTNLYNDTNDEVFFLSMTVNASIRNAAGSGTHEPEEGSGLDTVCNGSCGSFTWCFALSTSHE